MNTKDFAAHIGVPYGTVKRWIHEGMPRLVTPNHRSVEIDPDEATAWLQARGRLDRSDVQKLVLGAYRGKNDAVYVTLSRDPLRLLGELRKSVRDECYILFALPGDRRLEESLKARLTPLTDQPGWFTRKSVDRVVEILLENVAVTAEHRSGASTNQQLYQQSYQHLERKEAQKPAKIDRSVEKAEDGIRTMSALERIRQASKMFEKK